MRKFYSFALGAFILASAPPALGEVLTAEGGLMYDLNSDTGEAMFVGVSIDVFDELTEISIPATVINNGTTYKVTTLARGCCDGNPHLQKVVLGENVVEIGEFAFSNCTSLSTLTLNEGLQTIGASSFYKCLSLQSLSLPSTVVTIGDLAFYNANALQNVNFPASIETIGAGSFAYCRALKEFSVAEGNRNFTTEEGVLFNKDKTQLVAYPIGDTRSSYTIPTTVKTIGAHSMRNGLYLQRVEFNEGLDSIGNSAFTLSRLTEVNLPSSLRALGNQAFAAMASVTKYSVASGNANFKADGGFLLSADGKKLFYGVGNLSDLVIPEGVEEIGAYAYYSFAGIKTLKLASTTKYVGEAAFYSCSQLNRVDYGDNLESVGENSFRRCSQLTALNLPETMKSIGRAAFSESTGYTEIELPAGVEHLGEMAFARCYGLKKVTLPSSISEMDYGVFVYCNQLEEAVLQEGLTFVGDACFNECLSLRTVNFPESIKSIGTFAFTLTSLEHLNLNEGLETIGAAAFEFGKFQTLTLPSTVKHIDQFAFAWNDKLKSISLGESVETIGDFAFAGSETMTTLTLNDGLLTIGKGAFGSCTQIREIEIPSTVAEIGEECFAEDNALRKLSVKADIPPYVAGPLFTIHFDGYNIVELLVPNTSLEAYKRANEWSKFRTIFGDTSGIGDLESSGAEVKAIYTLDGMQVDEMNNGIYLIEMTDGTIKKIMK